MIYNITRYVPRVLYGCKRSDCWVKVVPSVGTGVFVFEKELTDVGGCGGWGTTGEATIEFVFVGVTLGGGVGTDTDGVGGLDVVGGGGVGFFTGAAVAIAVDRGGWAGIDVWLATGIPWPAVTAATATDCWLLPPNKILLNIKYKIEKFNTF